MSKDPTSYTPSPWLRLKENKPAKVRLPPAIVGALYRLQKDVHEIEYGGAIDFELIKDRPTVEKVLTLVGARRGIPGETWVKVFERDDVETTFHTHPKQGLAIPSEGDIIFFLTTPQKSMLIFAGDQALLISKGANTPPDDFCREHMQFTETTAGKVSIPAYDPKKALGQQAEMIKDLKTELDIDSAVFPAKDPIDVTVKMVKETVRSQ